MSDLKIEIWDWVIAKDGTVLQITGDDMINLKHEDIERLARPEEIPSNAKIIREHQRKEHSKSIENWDDLKMFCLTLTEDQLKQPVKGWGEIADAEIHAVQILDQDYINPTGEVAEPISDYSTIGDYTEEEIESYRKECLVGKKGEIFLTLQQ